MPLFSEHHYTVDIMEKYYFTPLDNVPRSSRYKQNSSLHYWTPLYST